jgi:SAM-dependent methyltransferase
MEADEYALMDAVESRMWWYRALHVRLRAALQGVAGPVLDGGCGTGGLLAQLGGVAYGVEYERKAARRAAEKSGAAVACGSVNALPFGDAAFGAVVSADVLCHAAVRPAEALAEFRRVLRPGGRLVVNMPAYQWMLSAHDRRVHNARRVTSGGLRAMLEAAGFRVRHIAYWNSFLFPLMVAQRLVRARGEAASDVAVFPPWQDALLYATTQLERRLKVALPFGGSVMAIAERQGE